MYQYTESGLFVHLLRKIRREAFSEFAKENRVYLTIKEFKDDFIKFDNLSVKSFKNIFLIYFSFTLILLVIFLIHNAFKFLKLRKKKIKETIKKYLIKLIRILLEIIVHIKLLRRE